MPIKKVTQNKNDAAAKTTAKTDIKKTTPASPSAAAKKPAAKKTTTHKKTSEPNIFIEFSGRQFVAGEIIAAVTEQHQKTNSGTIDTLDIYIKPDESVAYYVVNGNAEGKHILL